MNVSESRVIHIIFVVFSLSIGLNIIVRLKTEGRACFKVKVVSADAILVAINKWFNTNISEANKANQWEALQVLLHVWSYDFYDISYFTE